MKSLTLILSFSALAAILTSCSPNNGSTPSSTPNGPIVNNATVYGGTMITHNQITYSAGSNAQYGTYLYSASFSDLNGVLIDGGSLQANNMPLSKSSIDNRYFVAVPGFAWGPVIWIGGGSSINNIPSFNYMTKHVPVVPQIANDTIYSSSEYTYNHIEVFADSIEYKFYCPTNGLSISKIVTDSSATVSFTSSELNTLNINSATPVDFSVKAWIKETKTIGAKYYNFINYSSCTRSKTIRP